MSIYVYVQYIYWSIIVEALFLYKKHFLDINLNKRKNRHEDIVYS